MFFSEKIFKIADDEDLLDFFKEEEILISVDWTYNDDGPKVLDVNVFTSEEDFSRKNIPGDIFKWVKKQANDIVKCGYQCLGVDDLKMDCMDLAKEYNLH